MQEPDPAIISSSLKLDSRWKQEGLVNLLVGAALTLNVLKHINTSR